MNSKIQKFAEDNDLNTSKSGLWFYISYALLIVSQ